MNILVRIRLLLLDVISTACVSHRSWNRQLIYRSNLVSKPPVRFSQSKQSDWVSISGKIVFGTSEPKNLITAPCCHSTSFSLNVEGENFACVFYWDVKTWTCWSSCLSEKSIEGRRTSIMLANNSRTEMEFPIGKFYTCTCTRYSILDISIRYSRYLVEVNCKWAVIRFHYFLCLCLATSLYCRVKMSIGAWNHLIIHIHTHAQQSANVAVVV